MSKHENPYDAPTPENGRDEATEHGSEGMTSRQKYNLVSDTVVGPNVRWKDNLFQAVVVGVGLLVGGAIGALCFEPPIVCGIIGAANGAFVGLLLSGVALMIYRATRHMRGQHD